MEITDYFEGTGLNGDSFTSSLARTTLAVQDGLRGEFGKAEQLIESTYESFMETSRTTGRELLARPSRDEIYETIKLGVLTAIFYTSLL